MIYQPTYLGKGSKIGKNTKIGAFCDIGKNVVIGENCNIQCHVSLANGTRVGDNVFIGPGARTLSVKYPPSVTPQEKRPVTIKDGVCIGSNAVLLPGVTIGKYAIVGAGSIVTKNVVPCITVYGNPAR